MLILWLIGAICFSQFLNEINKTDSESKMNNVTKYTLSGFGSLLHQ